MFSTLCYTKLNAIFSTMNYTKVVMTPNYPVNFSAAFVGDVLTSTSRLIAHFLFSSTYSCMLISSFVLNNSRFSSSFSSSWWDCNHVMKQIFVPYITVIPLWIRLMQCLRCAVQSGNRWPHYGNAFKYAISFIVFSFGIFDVQNKRSFKWVVALIFVTLVQLSWDFFMDWGMSLRRPLLMNSRWTYAVFILMNIFIRFSWAISLLFNTGGFIHHY